MSGGEWGGLAVLLILWALVVASVWMHEREDDEHDRQPCRKCGRCCCQECREAHHRQPWRAPPGGGYHGCAP